MNLQVGVVGATGYAGQELVRLVARHPSAEVTTAMTSSTGDENRTLPALTSIWDGDLSGFDVNRLADADVVFLALPEAVSAELAPELLSKGRRVLDLSGAFRLRDTELRQRWYPKTPQLEHPIVYGLVERRREQLRDARFVSCPGCYPTAALLALEPLVAAGLVTGDITIDAKSGLSGAGRQPKLRYHFSECHANIVPYGVFSHRHGAEIEQELEHDVTFVPHLVPFDRGILETIYTRVAPRASAAAINDVFNEAYADAPFVRLRASALPEIAHVAYTNYCDIGWTLDEATGRLVIVSCIDNLLKGAAGQALQCMNVALGLDEREGLG